jgi:16S rRNA (guanine966-N2)-methyltransferase
MKDRVREATFNLIGPAIQGLHALDLFAGTGALGLEALSRGAARATLIEQHFPTAAIIRQNAETLDVEELVELVTANVFLWVRRLPDLGAAPWAVFCSPPFDFYVERTEEMLDLVGSLLAAAPAESVLAVESDGRFDFGLLPDADAWDVRAYPPAVVGIYWKTSTDFGGTAAQGHS